MKLRWRFAPRQLVSGFPAVTILATARAFAQHTASFHDDRQHEGQIVSVLGTTLQWKAGAGWVGVPLAKVSADASRQQRAVTVFRDLFL